MGILYIVGTPVGNMADISLRAMEILGKVSIVACEDTRRTGRLLEFIRSKQTEFGKDSQTLRPKLVSFTDYSESGKIPYLLTELQNGCDIALVSDAGSPLFADPGFDLVFGAIELGIRVESIPGAASFVSAVQVSGMPADRVLFWGFLPKKKNDKRAVFERASKLSDIEQMTLVFFESPFRIKESLVILSEQAPKAKVVVARELTKLHEEVIRGPAYKISSQLPEKLQGELILLVRFH